MNSNDTNTNHDDLDRLLRESLQVETPPRLVVPTEQFWRRRARARRRGRLVCRAGAVAATLLVAVGLSFWVQQGEPEQRRTRAPLVDQRPTPVESPPPDRIAVRQEDVPPLVGRAPTAYERLVFAARAGVSMPVQRPAVADVFAELLKEPGCDPRQDVERFLGDCGVGRAELERALLLELAGEIAERKQFAVRLLSACGTPRSVPALLDLSREEGFRVEALDTVEHIVGTAGLPEVVRRTPDRRVRTALLARLVRSDSDGAARGYLALVGDERFHDEAIAATDSADPAFVATLMDLLEDKNKAVRRAAAVVLGRVNGPEITESLIAKITDAPGCSTETWMALLACRGDRAEAFLAAARSNPQYLGRFNHARIEWMRMVACLSSG